MTAVGWYFLSALLFIIGAYVSLFAVTTWKGLYLWFCMGFMAGAILDVLLILGEVLRPAA